MQLVTRSSRLQRGDTIVEVLISIAVASMVLVTAYASTTRNLADIQDVQEHSQALKLVETQTEFLRSKGGITGGNCYDTTTGTATTSCTIGTVPAYDLKITPPVGSGPYLITATWGTLHDGAQATVTAYYRPFKAGP